MPTLRRLEKLNALLAEELSKIIDRELEFPDDFLVTVTRVIISNDARYASAHVSVFGGEPAAALEILSKNVYTIQQILNKRLRMRPVPKIRFMVDEQELLREKVEKSLAELKRKKEI